MNFVGKKVNRERVFLVFLYVRTVDGMASDSLIYLFGCYVFYWGESYGVMLCYGVCIFWLRCRSECTGRCGNRRQHVV